MLEKSEKVILSSVILLAFAPFVISNQYTFHILIIIFHHILLASSLNLVMSMGLLSVAQAAFMGIGAYTSVLLVMNLEISFWLALPIAGLFAGMGGVIIGFITLNIRGIYFAIATLAFNAVLRLIIINWRSFLGGITGIVNIPSPNRIDLFNLFSIEFTTKLAHYYLMLVFLALGLMVIVRINRFKIGRAFQAIRGSEVLAASTGIGVFRYKVFAFAMASIFAGLSGSLYAHYLKYINPEVFTFWQSFNYIVFVIVGGQGTFLGPIVGAILLTYVPEVLRVAEAYYMLFYSIVLIVIIMFVPKGIVPGVRYLIVWVGMRFFPKRMKKYEIA